MGLSIRGAQTGQFTVLAGQMLEIGATGDFVRCLESTATFEISLNSGSRLYFSSGIEYKTSGTDEFTSIQIFNVGGSPLTVTLGWGYGELNDNRLTATAALNIATPTGLQTTADQTVNSNSSGLIVAANNDRKEVIISNLADNGGKMRIGDSNVSSTRGVELSPGQSITLTTTAAIYAYNLGVSSQNVAILEVE